MEVVHPRWSSASFLVYAGGATVFGAAAGALSYLNGQYGKASLVFWAFLIFFVLTGVSHRFHKAGRRIAGGVFAFLGVAAFVAFVGTLFRWFGWLPGHVANPWSGFHVGKLLLELIAIVASVYALRATRFPLLVLAVTATTWLFVTDFVTSGGNWTAWVSLFVGLAFLAAGVSVDGGLRRPYGFWAHVASGLAIGGPVIFFWHSSVSSWAFVVVIALLFVWLARATSRSSWAVLGSIGLLEAAGYYTAHWGHTYVPLPFLLGNPFAEGFAASVHTRPWVGPVIFAVTGFVLVALGLWASRREPATPA